jgi:hypothetical protein
MPGELLFCNMNTVVYRSFVLLFLLIGAMSAMAQEEEEPTEPSTETAEISDQRLFFVPSFSNLTGFGAGLEYDIKKANSSSKRKYIAGLVLGAGAPNLIRPLYKGNKINVRLFSGFAISKAQLLLGWYFGSFGFDAPVDAAYLQSFTISVRYSPDKKQLWMFELGSSPFIPEKYENNGLTISPANSPPFLFFTILRRLTEKQKSPDYSSDDHQDAEAYPPVFVK